jgi:hypothetical protein
MRPAMDARMTYIGGPTPLVEVGGVRLLTDPTFDPAGREYRAASCVLRKTQGPALRRRPWDGWMRRTPGPGCLRAGLAGESLEVPGARPSDSPG